jgi:hypothetical protein
MPRKRKSAARKARGGDVTSKERACGCVYFISGVYSWGKGVRYHAHSLSYDENHGLICDRIWVCEEEIGEC